MNGNIYFKEAKRITFIGLFINLFLVVIKIVAGFLGKSSALIADGIHSFSDLSSDIVVLLGLKFSSKPSDHEHKYGHGKYETFANFILGVFLLVAAGEIFYHSYKQVHRAIFEHRGISKPAWITIIVVIFSIVLKAIIFYYTKFIGEKFNSRLLISNAYHHLSDSISSIGVLLGIIGARFLNSSWRFLDPLAAIFLSVLIFVLSIKIIKTSFDELVEKSLEDKDEKRILKVVNSVEGVIDPHNLKTRRIGNYIAIDVHIRVKRNLNILEAHQIATNVENKLKDVFGDSLIVNIHIEPEKLKNF